MGNAKLKIIHPKYYKHETALAYFDLKKYFLSPKLTVSPHNILIQTL